MEQKYYIIEKKTLALALNFMGFEYYKFEGSKGKMVYGFEDTNKFRKALSGILTLRNVIKE